jgi:hypothetical protein
MRGHKRKKESRHIMFTVWDHTIKLLPGAPNSLLGCLSPLTLAEKEEVHKFIKEHLA